MRTSLLIIQLVYHVFNHRGSARLAKGCWTESLLNRLLRFRPEAMSLEYAAASARLLQAASDIKALVSHVAQEILESLSTFFGIIARLIMDNKQPDESTVSSVNFATIES